MPLGTVGARRRGSAGAGEVALGAVPFVQASMVLLGVLAAVVVLGDSVALGGGAGAVACAAGYLTVLAMLSFAVALLVRHLAPALVSTLALALILSPLLAAQTEHARWLPDRAAQQLYSATDSVLSPVTGAFVALDWVAAIGGLAAVRFIRRDV